MKRNIMHLIHFIRTVGIDAPEQIFLEAHGIKTVVHLIITGEKLLALNSQPANIDLNDYKRLRVTEGYNK